ncbi:MAG: hypothetical protein HY079_06340 [Elusimicrobia bacterium]|nr:hypothetical protein [Elusimicrobiota bacterium]
MSSTIVGNTNLTLLDRAKRTEDGKVARIVEMMNRVNHMLTDAVSIEGNLATGHVTTVRDGLPSVAWRQINQGVVPSKSTAHQITMSAGLIEAMGQVDEELVEIQGDGAAFRLSENAPFIESIAQTLASTLLYGDTRVNPERFTGLSTFYSALNAGFNADQSLTNTDATKPDSGYNVIDASEGGVYGTPANGNNTSLWLVAWGENGIHTFFPKGTKAGIAHEDKGRWLVDDGTGTGAKFWAWIDQYKARMGLAVRDWRQAVRICNIDSVALGTSGSVNDTAALLIKQAVVASNRIWNMREGRVAWYCNRTVKSALDIQAMNKSNALLKISEEIEQGEPVTKLLGIPVRRVDALLNTEAQVS